MQRLDCHNGCTQNACIRCVVIMLSGGAGSRDPIVAIDCPLTRVCSRLRLLHKEGNEAVVGHEFSGAAVPDAVQPLHT